MPQQDPIKPGQVASIPQNTYDPNAEAGRVVNNLPNVAPPTAPNLLFDNTAPTGPNGQSKVNPMYALYINTLKNQNAKQEFLSTPYYTNQKVAERYSNNESGGYHPYDMNLENWYGENQSWLNQWGNRFAKLGTKALGSFANSMMDIPNMISAVGAGKLDKMWDNTTNNWATDLMDWSEKNLPNYETNWEREHPFANLTPFIGNSGNGWGKVLENLGFTIGAVGGAVAEDLIVGAMTGGVGEVPVAAMQINKAVYKLGKLINLGEDTLGGLKASIKSADDIVKGLKGIDRLNYAFRKGLWGANMITSGIGEAAFEAIDSYRALNKDLQQQFYEENGRIPTYEENQKIDRNNRAAGNTRFLMNSALLAVTNSIQWGNMLRPLAATKDLIEAEAKQGVQIALKEGSIDLFEAVDKGSKLAKWGRAIANSKVGSAFIESGSEMFEEGSQYWIEKGVNDFYKRKYNHPDITTTNNFIKSFGTGMAETLGTSEGWENSVYGLLGGAMYKGVEGAYYKLRGVDVHPDYKKQINNVLEGLNTNTLSGIFENKYGESVEAISIQKDLQKAAADGNVFAYKNYKHDQFVSFVISGIKQNKFETRMEQLQELKKLDNDEFKKTFGITASDENKKSVSDYVDAMVRNAEYINDVHKRVSRTFVNPFTLKGTGNYKNKEEKQKQDIINGKYAAYEEAKEDLVRTMSLSRDSANRTKALREQLSLRGGIGFPVEEAIQMVSEDGLKELKKKYKEQLAILNSLAKTQLTPDQVKSIKEEMSDIKRKFSQNKNISPEIYEKAEFLTSQLRATPETNKEKIKALQAKHDQIEDVLNEKDEKLQNAKYHMLVANFYSEIGRNKLAFYKNMGDDTITIDQLMHPDLVSELKGYAKDIWQLGMRNNVAIDRYARLTTKGGFKEQFEAIEKARKEAIETPVQLAPDQTQGQAAQQQAAFNTSQANAGQQTTNQPQANNTNTQQNPATQAPTVQQGQEGFVENKPVEDDSERARLVGYFMAAIEGKSKLDDDSLQVLGFQTIDELKLEDPNIDLKDYAMVTSLSGKKFYVPNTVVDQAKTFLEGVGSTSNQKTPSPNTPEQPDNQAGGPPVTPNTPPPVNEQSEFRTSDFMGKVWVAPDLKGTFNDAIFSGNKDQVVQNLSVTVRPLAPNYQEAYNRQQADQSFTQIPGFPGMYASRAPIDLSVSHNGAEIGKVAYPKRLLFKVGNNFVTIDRLTPEQYQQFTGKPAAQHAADVDEFNKQVAFTNYLALKFRNNNLQEYTLTPQELNELVDTVITYGELDLLERGQAPRFYSQVKHNTVSLPVANGNPINTTVIISIPKRLVEDTMVRERTDFMTPLYGANFYRTPGADDRMILDYLASSAQKLLDVNSRYIGLVMKPDGTIQPVALHPTTMTTQSKDEMLDSLKARSLESANANFIESTKEESTLKLLIGDREIYYKLPTDEAKNYNKQYNEELNNKLFISDPNGKVFYDLTLSPIGALRLDVHEPVSGYRSRVIIAPQKLATINTFDALVEAINKEVKKREEKDDVLKELGVTIAENNFKQSVLDDAEVDSADTLAASLIAATGPEVFKNGTMKFVPNEQNIQAAANKENRAATAQAAPERTEQGQPVPQPTQAPITPEEQEKNRRVGQALTGGNATTANTQDGRTFRIIRVNEQENQVLLDRADEQHWMPFNSITKISTADGQVLYEDVTNANVNPIEDLFGATPAVGGMFAETASVPVDQSGAPVTSETSTQAQEDQEGIAFPTVKDALNSVGIDYRVEGDTVQFFSMSTGEMMDLPGVSPKELAADMKLKVVEQQQPNNGAEFDFMRSDKNVKELNQLMDMEQAKMYLSSVLPSFIKTEDLETVINQIQQQGVGNPQTDVWGAYRNGIIYLNSQVPAVGQEYHEAFHAVFNILMSAKEQQELLKYATDQLYSQLKKEGKSIRDHIKEQKANGQWTNLSEKQATEKAAEEWMAEEFRKWNNKKKNAGPLQKLFDMIERFFKWLLRSGTQLDAVFNKINTGGYKYSNIASNSFTQETTDENTTQEFKFMLIPARPTQIAVGTGTRIINRNLDPRTSKQVIQNVAAYFEMYRKAGEYSKLTDSKLLDEILNDLQLTYNPNNIRYAGASQAQLSAIANSDENFIYSDEKSRKVIKDAAKKYINSMNYFEQFAENGLEEEEQDTGSPKTGYDNQTENIGGFSSLPGMLRHYIGFTSYPVTDRFGNTQTANGKPVIATIDAISVYYGLLRATANINDPVKFLQRMIRFADNNEQSRHFVEKFIKDTGLNEDVLFGENRIEANKNQALLEMVKKGFNKYRIDYVFTHYDAKKGQYVSYAANRKNVENVQFEKWSNNFIDGYAEMSEENQATVRRAIDRIRNTYFDPRRALRINDEELSQRVNEVRSILSSIGIQMSHDFVKYSLLSIGAKKFDELNKQYKAQGAELQFDDPQNIFISKSNYNYVQVMKIADEITLNRAFMDELSKTLTTNANPFFRRTKEEDEEAGVPDVAEEGTEGADVAMVTRILNVAKGNAFFDETVGESSFTTADNKVVFAHQDGTFNVKYSYQLRDANTRRQLREQGYREEASAAMDAYDAEWLTRNFLLNSADFEAVADNLQYQNIDGLRAVETNKQGQVITQEFRDQKEGVTYGSYSPREFFINNLNFYVSYKKIQKTGAGDIVTTPHLIRVLEASKTGATVNLPINLDVYREGTVTEKTLGIMLGEVEKEYNRIQRVQGEIGTLRDNIVENYHTGSFQEDGFTVNKGYRGLKFSDNMTALLTKATANLLERKARNGDALSDEDKATIKEEVKNALNKMVDDTMNLMVKEGIIKVGQNGDYNNVLLHRKFVVGDADLNLQSVSKNEHFKTNIGHVLLNDYINTLAYNQILHGDPALSLKNDGGIDAVKRAKGDNAAIVSIRTDLLAPELGITEAFTHSKVAIFKEPISADGTKIADAQMYTTVKGLRYTLWGLGRLSPRLAKFLDVLEDGGDIHNIEYTVKNERGEDIVKRFDGVFDDEKGILAWDEMTNSLKLVFKDGKSYFKMSVVVLQPDLTSYKDVKTGEWKPRPNWKTLDTLRRKMEADGIHFAAPESASKMMTLDVSKAADFSDLKGHLYDNNYFGLQTENPSNKLEITTPTQLLQLIDSEQSDNVQVVMSGVTKTIRQVKDEYQNAVLQKVSNSFDAALNEIYDITEFNDDLNKLISEGKVQPRLATFYKRVASTLESSGSDAQLLDFFSLDDNGNIRFNANLSAVKTKSQQLYLSYFSKSILSQKNPGYTVALFSGIDTKMMKRAKRVVDGRVVEWDYVTREHWDTNYNGVQSERVVTKEQVTEVGQLFQHELEHEVSEYDENGKPTGQYYSEFMLPAHFKELLGLPRDQPIPEAIAKMFGVRIPSQDKHSFISLRLVDFLPANLGSTGMFPKELIALSGADFDIDKLFITRYDFYMEKDKNGNTQFKKYGSATTSEEKWAEYKDWMGKNNKAVKGIVADIAEQDTDYQGYLTNQNPEDLAAELLGMDVKKRYLDRFVAQALGRLKLPSTLEEFVEASRTKELNNGVLNNKILDSYTALLTNEGMRDIAKTPASLTALADIQDNDDITLKDSSGKKIGSVFGSKVNYPVDSMIGKYNGFKNNTTGKNNIGIDVNANLIYSSVNKGEISLRDPEQAFKFDDVTFDSFAGDREYGWVKENEVDVLRPNMGKRTNDVLSTLITAATDEAKEQLNALYNLGVDALKVVNYLVSLKVPLKTAIYFVNQPSIRNYLDLKAVNQNTIRTKEEEDINKDAFRQEAIAKTAAQIKDYASLSDDDLYSMLESNGIIEVEC